MSQDGIKHAVRCGRWKRFHRGVYLVDGVPESFRQRAASVSQLNAVCSHRCAAAIYGLDGISPRYIEVVTNRTYKPRGIPEWVISHRTCHLPDDHISEHAGIAVTNVARTLLDLAGAAGHDVMRRASLSAVDKGLVTPEALQRQLKCCGRSGRPGVAAFRHFLTQVDWQNDFSDSDLEDIAFKLIVKSGLPAPKRLYRVVEDGAFLGELDLAYPTERVGIEVDSFAFHGDRTAFVRDRGRLNGFSSRSNWRILHFVYADADRPNRFLGDLRGALKRTQVTFPVR